MTARVAIRFVVAVTAALGACEHSAPFRPEAYGPTGPLGAGSPLRLTFNPGQDLVPAWLPNGSDIVYTAERPDRADRDRCLGFMPAAGGAISRYACRTTAADDSLNVFEEAAFSGGDSVVYVRASTERFVPGIGPDAQQLVVAAADPNDARVLQSIPFTAPWGTTYDALSHIAWLGPSRVAAVGERVTYPRACSSCVADTVRTGIGIVIVDFAAAAPVLTRLADGDSASSLAAAANGDTLYFTRDGDSRVYRHAFASGLTDTLYDFGFGIARDVSVANGRLTAVVGGAVSYAVDSVLGGSQPDHGGPLYLVVAGGPPAQIGDPASLYRRPAFSPDGRRLVVAAWNVSATADIWLFQLP
jgi:hypothetical protein